MDAIRLRILLWCVVASLTSTAGSSAQPILHVDARSAPGGNGASWGTAYRDLQDALDHARIDPSVHEIWVAGGKYKPDRDTADRAATFALVSNVGVFGGFLGDELSRSERHHRTSETILSGDIGISSDPSDNSKAVVSALPGITNTCIENVTVLDGNGTWGSGLDIHSSVSDISVIGCWFRTNLSVWGGAVLIGGAESCSVIDCDFDSNTASHGGGLYLNNIATTTEITSCRFYNNYARGFGGAVANSSSHPIFRNCTFVNNRADREGGALSNSGGDALFVSCILWENAPTPIRDQESVTTITYSCIAGGWPGQGNFSADPKLVDPANGDLRLAPNSPCIDSGDNDGVPPDQTLDLDFNPRLADDTGTPDTGRGTAPIVDLGCYEFQNTSFALLDPMPGEAGRVNRLSAIGATPGATIWFAFGRADGTTNVPGCPGLVVHIALPRVLGNAIANGDGIVTINRFVPESARGTEIIFQGVDQQRCVTTHPLRTTFE